MLLDINSNSSCERQHPAVCCTILYCYNATKFFLVTPLYIFILYQAVQQWRQQRGFSTASHSDMFTFHYAITEMFWVLGTVIYGCYYLFYSNILMLHAVSSYLLSVSANGQSFFQMLTCVERYLAVVHPITYRGLKNSRGARVRDFSIGSVWLLCFMISFLFLLDDDNSEALSIVIVLGLTMVFTSFCSVSVLCVVIRPRPGEGGRDRERVDPLKLRVFFTIIGILGAIWMWFLPFVIASQAVFRNILVKDRLSCLIESSAFWLNLPCSLVLPLLYLHRTGRLSCHSNG